MNVLVVLDGSKNDKFLLEESKKFTNSNKSNIFTLYVIEVTQKLEIDTQLEEEILLGENILKKSEKFLGLSKNNNQAQLVQSRHRGSAIVNEIIRNDIKLLIVGSEYPQNYGDFEISEYINYLLKNSPCDVFLLRSKSIN